MVLYSKLKGGARPLRIRVGNELILLNLLVLLLVIAIIFFPSNVLRIILGLPFVLFFPGYALMAALFAGKEGMSSVKRVALSFGMSIAVVPLTALILNATPWGITLEPVLYAIASFILIMSIIAWIRRKRLPKEERFSIEFQLAIPSWGGGAWDKTLSIILIVSVVGALGIMGYVIAKPKVGEIFTEFYILGLAGKAAGYPTELELGEEGKVIVGIINREHETVSYRLEVRIDGIKNNEVGSIVLEHDEKWEREISFVSEKAGENQKVEFFLYLNGEAEPYLEPLRVWVDVRK